MKDWDNTIVRYLAGESSAEEVQELQTWLRQDEQHERYMATFRALWEHGSVEDSRFSPDLNVAQQQVLEKIRRNKISNVRPLVGIRLFWPAAAVLLLGLSIASMVYFFQQRSTAEEARQITLTSTTPIDVVLPDGTKVWLNSDTRILYPQQFAGESRTVELEGEAFFEVAHNPNQPFIIQAGGSVTRVVGTSFNLRALSAEQEVIVTVSSGKVMVYPKAAEESKVFLEKGERSVFARGSSLVKRDTNRDINYLSWRTGQLVFNNTPLKDVALDLSRHFRLIVAVSDDLDGCRLTSTFDSQPLEDILEELRFLMNITVERTDGYLLITGTGC